jgi:hypothetical protein
LPLVIAKFLRSLEEQELAYMIGGSYASSVWGSPRQTNDLDIELELEESEVDEFFSRLDAGFLGGEEECREALRQSDEFRGFQLLHSLELFKVDVFLPLPGPYTKESFVRRQRREVLPGESFWVKSAEDIILTKLRWFRLGGEVSDRQWNDIIGVLEVQAGSLDETYLRRWSADFAVDNLLANAMKQAASGADG